MHDEAGGVQTLTILGEVPT